MSDYQDMVCWQNYKDAVDKIEKIKKTARLIPEGTSKSFPQSTKKLRQDAMDVYRYYQGNLDEILPGLGEEEHNDFWSKMDGLWELIYNL